MQRAKFGAGRRGAIEPGGVWTYDLNRFDQPHHVINVATKKHWRGKSTMEYVESGLRALVDEVKRLGIKSVAVPPLGCGLRGLHWQEVRPRIKRSFAELTDVQVLLYEPMGEAAAEEMAKDGKIET